MGVCTSSSNRVEKEEANKNIDDQEFKLNADDKIIENVGICFASSNDIDVDYDKIMENALRKSYDHMINRSHSEFREYYNSELQQIDSMLSINNYNTKDLYLTLRNVFESFGRIHLVNSNIIIAKLEEITKQIQNTTSLTISFLLEYFEVYWYALPLQLIAFYHSKHLKQFESTIDLLLSIGYITVILNNQTFMILNVDDEAIITHLLFLFKIEANIRFNTFYGYHPSIELEMKSIVNKELEYHTIKDGIRECLLYDDRAYKSKKHVIDYNECRNRNQLRFRLIIQFYAGNLCIPLDILNLCDMYASNCFGHLSYDGMIDISFNENLQYSVLKNDQCPFDLVYYPNDGAYKSQNISTSCDHFRYGARNTIQGVPLLIKQHEIPKWLTSKYHFNVSNKNTSLIYLTMDCVDDEYSNVRLDNYLFVIDNDAHKCVCVGMDGFSTEYKHESEPHYKVYKSSTNEIIWFGLNRRNVLYYDIDSHQYSVKQFPFNTLNNEIWHFSVCLFDVETKLFICGGLPDYDKTKISNKVRIFSSDLNSELTCFRNMIIGRYQHGICYHDKLDQIIVAGGFGKQKYKNMYLAGHSVELYDIHKDYWSMIYSPTYSEYLMYPSVFYDEDNPFLVNICSNSNGVSCAETMDIREQKIWHRNENIVNCFEASYNTSWNMLDYVTLINY